MTRKILIALILLLATVGGLFAQESETASDKLEGKSRVNMLILTAPLTDYAEGQDVSAALRISVIIHRYEDQQAERPAKYRISWTVNKRWLAWTKPNPAHGRRGNLFVDYESDSQLVEANITVPAGKTLRVRVRPIYADKTRGEDCIATVDGAPIHFEPDSWEWFSHKDCNT